MGLAYVCENSVAKPKACDFRSGRIILQQEILPEQMAKLLNDGRTDLLPGFVSQRTRRPFKAYLAKGKDGKVSFEFEPRKPKAPGKGVAPVPPGGDAAVKAVTRPVSTKAVSRKPAAKKISTNVAAAAPTRKPVLKGVAAKKSAASKATAKKAVAKKVAVRKGAARKTA